MISSVPVSRVAARSASWKPGSGQDDADVRQRRLGEHAGDVAVGELALERLDVVALDDARGLGERHRRPDVALARDDAAVASSADERLVDRAVVAPVEDEDLRPPGELARRAGSRSGWRRSRSARTASAAGRSGASARAPTQSASSLGSISRDPAAPPARRPRGRVGSGEWPVIAPVSPRQKSTYSCPSTSREARALRLGREDREAAGPADHPGHRHAAEQRAARLARPARASAGARARSARARARAGPRRRRLSACREARCARGSCRRCRSRAEK